MRKRLKTSPSPVETARASRVGAAFAVFAVALVVRLLAAWQLGSLPISRTPQLDSAAYLAWAREIARTGFAWPAFPEHSPGYPFFVAAILSLFDGSLMAVRVCQSLLGSFGCVLTARVAARTVGARAFLWAGLLQALYAPLIYVETALLAEAMLVFLLVLTIEILTAGEDRANRWLAGGATLGAACVVRPTAVVLVPAFLVLLVKRYGWRTQTRLASVAFLGGVLMLIGPVVIQNWRVTGIPLIQAYGGMNTYLGNRPSGDGMARARLGGEWDRLEAEASRAGVARNDQDRYYLRRTVSEITENPARYVALLASKLSWTLQDDEIRDTHSFYFFTNAWTPLGWLPSFGWIAALAVVGIIVTPRRDRTWLLVYAAAILATIVFLVVGTRYRMPLMPAVMVFAGAGLAAVIEALRSRRWDVVSRLTVVLLLTWAASQLRHDPASHNLAEEHALTGLSLLQEKRPSESELAYRSALAADPNSSFAWDGLGLVMQHLLLRNDARSAFERAVEINPSNATAWIHLGYAHELLGNPGAALNSYRRALMIAPQRGEAIELYAAARRRYRQ